MIDINTLVEERDRYKAALEYISLGKAVNPQGYAMKIIHDQDSYQYHRNNNQYTNSNNNQYTDTNRKE